MSLNCQKVLIVHDASRELSVTLRHILQSLSLRYGDIVKLLGVISAFRKDSRMNSTFCISFSKRKTKMHPSATINKHKKDIEEEVQRKIDEYSTCAEGEVLKKIADNLQVRFDITVEAGQLKEVAVEYAKNFQATHVILPGQLRKELKYFTENLECRISRIRQDNSMVIIKTPEMVVEFGMSSSGTRQETTSNQENSDQPTDTFRDSSCSLCMNRRIWFGQKRQFTYAELHYATTGFSKNNLLPDHGRKLYKGLLNCQSKVLVREQPSVSIKKEEFEREVMILGKIRHENVSMIIGFCSEGQERMLVYEYVCNGSLNSHLSNKNIDLTWERRISIAYGAAKGLECLQRENIYGSMRPSNILLTHDYKPLVSCYGFAINQYEDLRLFSQSSVLKTFEHLAPEYGKTGLDLSKADVFSFGVILLELISGRKSLEETDGQSFLRWGRSLLREKKYMELIDPILKDSVDVYQLFWMVRVADKCLSWDPNSRYSIKKVVVALARIIEHDGVEDFSPAESELMI